MNLVPTKPSLKLLATLPAITMTMTSPSLLVLLLVFLPFLAADPDPLQDFCVADLKATSISINGLPCRPASEVVSADFFFDGLAKEGNTTNVFGLGLTAGNVFAFPGLNTLGLSMNRVDYAPGGVNPPHSHPRATEAVLVIKGKLLVGFVATNNVLYSKVLSPGEMFVIPPGLVHFQQNVGVGKALSITAFNSQFPGAVVIPQTLFGSNPSVPSEVLGKAFQMEPNVVTEIKSKFGN